MRLLSQDNGELRRVSQSALLPQGARLLVPRDTPANDNSHVPDDPNDHASPLESNAGIVRLCLPPRPEQRDLPLQQNSLTRSFSTSTMISS